jgi:hypothetical protein
LPAIVNVPFPITKNPGSEAEFAVPVVKLRLQSAYTGMIAPARLWPVSTLMSLVVGHG